MLPLRVASVKACAAKTVIVGLSSTTAVTGIAAMSAGPSYSVIASAPTVKVRVASVSKSVPSNISLRVTFVALTRTTSDSRNVTPAIPDTCTALLMSALACVYTPLESVSVTILSLRIVSVKGCGV